MMTPPFYYPLDQRGVSEFYTALSIEKIQERRVEPAREDLERDEARRRGITSQLRGGLLVKAGRNRQPPDL